MTLFSTNPCVPATISDVRLAKLVNLAAPIINDYVKNDNIDSDYKNITNIRGYANANGYLSTNFKEEK